MWRILFHLTATLPRFITSPFVTMLKQLAFFLSLAASTSALHLTPENWDAETAGKTIFVKFYAPW
jgi:hypothetical protein